MKNFQYILTYNDLGFSETLNVNPINWDQLSLTFARSEIYNSVLRSFTLSLRFTKIPGAGGKNIIDSYNEKGISASVDIQIKEYNTQTGDYDPLYIGILDFNPDRFQIERDWIEIGILDADKLQKFKAREEINFDINKTVSADEISVDPFLNSPKEIVFKPIDIFLKVVSTGNYEDEFYFSTNPNPPGAPIGTHYSPGSTVNIKYYADDVEINEIGSRFGSTSGPDASERTLFIYNNSTESDATIIINDFSILSNSMKIDMREFSGLNIEESILKLLARTYDENDDILVTEIVDTVTKQRIPGPTNPQTSSIVFDASVLPGGFFAVPPGGKFSIIIETTTNDISSWDITSSHRIYGSMDVVVDITEKSLSVGQTISKSYFPFEAFSRLIQLITSEIDDQKLFYSVFFGRTDSEFITYPINGPGALDAITTAWNLRTFPNRAFNLNLSDLFQTFNSIYGLGLGYDRINDRFYIEPVANFYRSDLFLYDLGEVSDLVIKPHKESFNSKIDSGYSEKGDYEDFQGVNEYNLESEHSTVLPVKQTKAGRAKYNADSIGIELTRRQQYTTDASKDTKQDDKIYIVRTDGSYTIQNGLDVSGFEGINQYYNIKLTPRENMIRHAGLIKSSLWLHDLRIKFIKAKKDINISYTNQNSDPVNEFDDLIENDLIDPQIYVPEVYEFSSIVNSEIINILNSNPHGYFKFLFDGIEYHGFILTVETGYYDRKANYTLLAKEVTTGDNYIFENEDNYVFEDGNNYMFD